MKFFHCHEEVERSWFRINVLFHNNHNNHNHNPALAGDWQRNALHPACWDVAAAFPSCRMSGSLVSEATAWFIVKIRLQVIACQIGNAVLLLLESVFFQSFPMQQRNQHCTLYFYTIAIDAEYVSSHCGSTGGSKQCVQLATSSEKGTIDFNSIHVFFETNQTLTSNLKTCPGSRRSHLFPWEKQLRLASEICFFWGWAKNSLATFCDVGAREIPVFLWHLPSKQIKVPCPHDLVKRRSGWIQQST